jgi:hypothetical protein
MMEVLRSLLQGNDINLSDEELLAELKKRGFDWDELSDDDAMSLADQIILERGQSATLATSNGKNGKAAKRPRAKTKKAQEGMDDYKIALANQAKQKLEEISAFNTGISQGVREFAHREAQKTIEDLDGVTNEYLAEIAEYARDYKGEPEAFFRFGQEIASLYLSAGNSDAAE